MQKKQAKAASESLLFLLVVAGIVVAINVLGVFLHVRADTTDNELFSLSEGSRNLVSRLEDRMEIRAYFTDDLPPPHNSTERYVRDLLAEYSDAAGGKLTVSFISPTDDETRQQAERDGITRGQDQVLESNSFSVQENYRGLSIHYLGDRISLARVDTTAGLEYEITQAMKQLMGEKVPIGVLGGHEGPSLAQGLTSLKSYLPTYELKEVKADKEIPDDIRALLIIEPQTPLTETELRYIDQYVMRGGSLGVFGGSFKLELTGMAPKAVKVDTGLNQLLDTWGVTLNEAIVADSQCGRAPMRTNLGFSIGVPYPPVPVVTFDEEQQTHPVVFRLRQVLMPYTAEVILQRDVLKKHADVQGHILARSSKGSWLMDGEEDIDLTVKRPEDWQPSYAGPYTLGVVVSGNLPSAFAVNTSTPDQEAAPEIEAPAQAERPAKVLVVGGGSLLRDEFMPKPQGGGKVFGGGVAFPLNAVDWLANDEDLMAIRAKNIEDPPLEVPAAFKEAEDEARAAAKAKDEDKYKAAVERGKAAAESWKSKKRLYNFANMLGLPVAFAAFGLFRWRRRRAKKAKLTL